MRNINNMDNLEILLIARVNGIWIQTEEEADCVEDIIELVQTSRSSRINNMDIYEWSFAEGTKKFGSENVNKQSSSIPGLFEMEINSSCKGDYSSNNIWILKDAHGQHFGANSPEKHRRYLRDILEYRPEENRYNPIIVISPVVDIHPDLAHLFEVITYDTPDLYTVMTYISKANNRLVRMEQKDETMQPLSEGEIEEYAKLCVGMSRMEIEKLLRKSSVKYHAINRDMLTENKIMTVRKTGALDYKIPKITLKDIGGHKYLKEWLKRQQRAYSNEAREFGLELPKGYMSVGLSGCGKTAIAEAFAGEMGIPLLSLAMDKIMSRMVGESERKIAKALSIAKSCSPCVLLIDECEKAIGGVISSNQSDSGITARIFQALLQFMNDNEQVYVIMTSNNIAQLPPELTRAGRLDKTWFFDFPDAEERREIFKIHLEKNGFEATEELLENGVNASNNYTGAEIEQSVKNAKMIAFDRYMESGEKKLEVSDLITGISEVIPIFKSAREQVSFCKSYCLDQGRASATNKPPKNNNLVVSSEEEFCIEDAF